MKNGYISESGGEGNNGTEKAGRTEGENCGGCHRRYMLYFASIATLVRASA